MILIRLRNTMQYSEQAYGHFVYSQSRP